MVSKKLIAATELGLNIFVALSQAACVVWSLQIISKGYSREELSSTTSFILWIVFSTGIDSTKQYYIKKYSDTRVSYFEDHLFNFVLGLIGSVFIFLVFFVNGLLNLDFNHLAIIISIAFYASLTPYFALIDLNKKTYCSNLFRSIFVSIPYLVAASVSHTADITYFTAITISTYMLVVSIYVYQKLYPLKSKSVIFNDVNKKSRFILFNTNGLAVGVLERIIVGRFLGAEYLAVFNLFSDIYNKINAFLRLIANVALPRLVDDRNRDVAFKIAILIALLISNIYTYFVINYVDMLVEIQFGVKYLEYSSLMEAGLMLFVFSLTAYVITLKNISEDRFQIQSKNYLYSSIFYLCSMIILSYYFQFSGLVFSILLIRLGDINALRMSFSNSLGFFLIVLVCKFVLVTAVAISEEYLILISVVLSFYGIYYVGAKKSY